MNTPKSTSNFLQSVFLFLAVSVTAVFFTAPVHASLIGQTIDCSIKLGNSVNAATPTNPVVGPGAECQIDGQFNLPGFASVDFSEVGDDTFLEILFFGGSTRYFFDFTDLFWSDDPTAIITGLDLITDNLSDPFPNVSYDNHSISIDALDLGSTSTGKWLIQTVPVPAPALLMVLGLLGLFITRRRQVVR